VKVSQLNHSKTPYELRIINDQLDALITAPESEGSAEQLQLLIDTRDRFILAYLDQLSTTSAEAFAIEELKVNQWLVSTIAPLKSKAKTDLQQLSQGKKAIKKYK